MKATLTKYDVTPENNDHIVLKLVHDLNSMPFKVLEQPVNDNEVGNRVIHCYCCDKFTEHLIFENDEDNYYECNDCGCVIDDSDLVITPDQTEV